ncbi:hypothetical protein N476_09255 [Pseudoalteromonas luteoviolacea H33]|uniref:Uncharacterized protein n=1 Tax=Pseudoalteromonas luteoviolacea H33 TaxID=1365251 RepID=A0A167FTE1_9GAMM|nr:hypothetical protein N476_09255 [Pseudoalteromonas luteoviolacea H33]KZN78122.1 hypothetical protein N477_10810 [Pseudoalteromonas luteoviolacea H33-S]
MTYSTGPVLINLIVFYGFQISLFITLLYFLYELNRTGFSKLYDKSYELNSDFDKRFVSWSLTFIVIAILHFTDMPVNDAILDADMDQTLRRRLFYFLKMCFSFTSIVCIYVFHHLRGCPFSSTARNCIYVIIPTMTINFVELVSRGYLDVNSFIPIYRFIGIFHYVFLMVALNAFPIYRVLLLRKANRVKHKEQLKNSVL